MQLLPETKIKQIKFSAKQQLENELQDLQEETRKERLEILKLREESKKEALEVLEERRKVFEKLEADKRQLLGDLQVLEQQRIALEASSDAQKLKKTLQDIETKESELDLRLSQLETERESVNLAEKELWGACTRAEEKGKALTRQRKDLQMVEWSLSQELKMAQEGNKREKQRIEQTILELSMKELQIVDSEGQISQREAALQVLLAEIDAEREVQLNERRALQDAYAQLEKSKKEIYGASTKGRK